MAKKRQLPQDVLSDVIRRGAVAEAYGCYFDREGNVVFSASSVAHAGLTFYRNKVANKVEN